MSRSFAKKAIHAAIATVGCGAVAGSISCGGGFTEPSAFSTDWSDDRGASIERVRLRLAGAHAPAQLDIAVGVVDDSHLVGLPLAGAGKPWTFVHPLDARPSLAGNVVVGSGAGEIFALDGRTGALLWQRPTGALPLASAGDDGKVTVVILERPGSVGSTLLAVARDGSVVRQVETDKALGSPAVFDGLAFVPWGSEYVTVFDLSGGGELGRVVLRETVQHAWTFGGSVFFGELGIFRFDARIGMASRGGATHLTLPPRELPGVVRLYPPSNRMTPVAANAFDEARLFASASPGEGSIALEGDRLYATYFRLIMGLDAKGKLAWVRRVESDVFGGAAGTQMLATCDASGKVSIFDAANGATHEERQLGSPLRSCVVQIDGYQPTGTAQPAGSRFEQLSAALRDTDAQLVPAQKVLLSDLADDPSDAATMLLLQLSTDPRTAPEIADEAGKRIASRKSGADGLLKELARHYDYVNDVLRPPPVAAIAAALAAMHDARGADPLVLHLFDPADTDEDVRAAAAALETLAGPAQLESISRFFSAYRATTENDVLAEAAASAAKTLLAQGTDEQKVKVVAALRSKDTSDALKARLRQLSMPAMTPSSSADAGAGADAAK